MKLKNVLYFSVSSLLGILLGIVISGKVSFSDALRDSKNSLSDGARNSLRSDAISMPSHATTALTLAENGDHSKVDEFLANWLQLHPDDKDFVIGHLSGLFYADTDQYYPFIRDFQLTLFEQDRAMALDMVSFFPREQRIANLERHLLDQWVTLDSEELFSNLSSLDRDNAAVNGSQLLQLGAIFNQEKKDLYANYLSWVRSLDPENENDSELQRAAYQGLSHHASDDNRATLFAELEEKSKKDLRLSPFPALLVSQELEQNPQQAVEWLEGMEPGPWKEQALYVFLSTAGEFQPATGADLMNREEFLSEFAIRWEENDAGEVFVSETPAPMEVQQDYYDASLERFLGRALGSDPTLVLESAEAFYSEELKKGFQDAAREILAGEELPVTVSSETSHTCGPNCNHDH